MLRVLSHSGSYNSNTIDWVADKQQKFISRGNGGWEGVRELSVASAIRALVPFMRAHGLFTSQRLHLLMPSPWGEGFSI